MAKFSNVKPTNTVYHLLCGKGTVTTVSLASGKVVFLQLNLKAAKLHSTLMGTY